MAWQGHSRNLRTPLATINLWNFPLDLIWLTPRCVPGACYMRVNLNLFPEELLPPSPLHCPEQLLDLLDWAIELQLLHKDADVSDLHRWCMAEGLSLAAWRLLAKYGEQAYQAVPHDYLKRKGRFTECLCYLEWQARAGLQHPLPVPLGQQLLVVGTHAGMVPPVDPRLIRAAARHWVTVCRANLQAQFASQAWVQVMVWMRDESPQLDSNQWRAGWPAIWREYEKWTTIQNARGQWAPMLETLTAGEYVVTPLATAAALVQEGWLMRHCAGDYVDHCRVGQYLMFAVALRSIGKRVATVGIKRDGQHWRLDQVQGKANRDPGPNVHRVARLIEMQVAENELQRNLQRATSKLIRQIERRGRIDIRVGWEGGDAPLMLLDDQFWHPAQLDQLPLTDNLRARLQQWSARFRAFPPCQLIDEQDWNEMDDQLRGFAQELRCVLGPEYRVVGYAEPAKERAPADVQW